MTNPMKKLMLTLAGAMLVLAGTNAWAQEDDADRPPRRGGEFRQRMIEEFDADGDGQLNEEERQTARETMRERRGNRGPRPERSADGQDSPGRDPGAGRGGRPDPNELFDRFDENGDGMLSREEFRKFTDQERDRRGGRGIGGPGRGPGAGQGNADRPRPPREARDVRPGEPLLNPADQTEVAPPADRQPPPRGRGFGPGPRGPEAESNAPRGGPGLMVRDPDQVFDRFDANGDNQLSREEFLQLTASIRQRAAGRVGPPEGAGRGRGRGGPDEGGRPPRRQRPPLEDGFSDPPVERDTF